MTIDLIDRASIIDQISAVGRCLDERDFDGLRGLFAADATISTPGGTATGHDALVDQARRRHTEWEATQHLITNVLIALDGDTASARANLLVVFVGPGEEPYQQGGVYQFVLLRGAQGWRFSEMSTSRVWAINDPAA
jgi:SnoaL-like domain